MENEPKVAFVGDLVFNGHHPYIADDHIFDWLKNLEQFRELLANITTIHPGHGKSGSIVLSIHRKVSIYYIDAIRELSRSNSTLTEKQKGEANAKNGENPSWWRLSILIAQSADSVAAELNNKIDGQPSS